MNLAGRVQTRSREKEARKSVSELIDEDTLTPVTKFKCTGACESEPRSNCRLMMHARTVTLTLSGEDRIRSCQLNEAIIDHEPFFLFNENGSRLAGQKASWL